MSERNSGVRWGSVGLTALGAGIVALLLLLVWRRAGGDLPTLPWLALVPLLILSTIVLLAGWQVRGSIQAPPGGARAGGAAGGGPGSWGRAVREVGMVAPGQMSPQRARGTLVAAQSSALGGAVLVGWYLANAFLAAPDADVVSVRALLIRALVSAAGAAVLAVCGMVAQSWCRVPPADDDDDGGDGATGRGSVRDPLPD